MSFSTLKSCVLVVTGWFIVSQVNAQDLPDFQQNPSQHVKAMLKLYQQPVTASALIVQIKTQKMYHFKSGKLIKRYTISSSKYGIGNQSGSNKTPLGVHIVKTRFGQGAKRGTIFKARVNTGSLAEIITDNKSAKADYVTTRILWLSGLEKGKNKGKGIDSYKRYIYIHGTPEEGKLGRPASHGCIRMYNDDVIRLFADIPVGTLVNIIR
ncbi:Glutamate synthase [NADPH] large chain [hydrothermal vent metagenome]|uniref:Glutamate synthase [NADPH] large chain n=1 Tax=hydrothermal vent metagenome TaxID=652676 RepID=A0A3B0Z3M1_9ZZZZ